MSLMSFPRTHVVYDVDNTSDPTKLTLTFRGPTTAPLAHAIDPTPSVTDHRPVRRTHHHAVSKPSVPKKVVEEPVETPEKARYRKKMESLKRGREEFLEKGHMLALYGTIEERVKCACMSTDHLLAQKQTRLRELLLAEEVAYTTEYISMCQQANANREEELKQRAFELQSKHERERQKFVDQKLLEHIVDECDAARPVLTQKHLMEVKKDQLWQIKEKYALQEARREEEKMYHDLMIKNMQALKENEEEAAKLAWLKQKETQKAFQEQMKLKEQKTEQERQLKEYERLQLEQELRLIKEEKEQEKMDKMKKKQELKAEIKEELARDKEIKERRKKEEEEIERAFAKLMKIEEEKEKAKESSEKIRVKREMDIFLEASRELKRQKEEEQRKFNDMLEELNEKKRQQKDAERRKLKAAREELFSNVLREREEQIKAKREREKREEEQTRAELEVLSLQLEQQRKIREDFERRCAEQRAEYRCQLMRQIEEAEAAKKKKKQDEDEYVRQMKMKEDEEIDRVKRALQMVPIRGLEHPMKAMVTQEAPRYMCPFPCPR